jgi:hypothetical protein
MGYRSTTLPSRPRTSSLWRWLSIRLVFIPGLRSLNNIQYSGSEIPWGLCTLPLLEAMSTLSEPKLDFIEEKRADDPECYRGSQVQSMSINCRTCGFHPPTNRRRTQPVLLKSSVFTAENFPFLTSISLHFDDRAFRPDLAQTDCSNGLCVILGGWPANQCDDMLDRLAGVADIL